MNVNKYCFNEKELNFFIKVKTGLIESRNLEESAAEKAARFATIMLQSAITYGKDYYRESLKIIHRLYGDVKKFTDLIDMAKQIVIVYVKKVKTNK